MKTRTEPLSDIRQRIFKVVEAVADLESRLYGPTFKEIVMESRYSEGTLRRDIESLVNSEQLSRYIDQVELHGGNPSPPYRYRIGPAMKRMSYKIVGTALGGKK